MTIVCPDNLNKEDTLTYQNSLQSMQKQELEQMVWLDPVSRTDKGLCKSKRGQALCDGGCLRVCPVGE
jgi:cytochrome b involved in lipid metabolism